MNNKSYIGAVSYTHLDVYKRQLFQLETWKEYEAVLTQDLCTFLCVPRPGDPMHKVCLLYTSRCV